MRVEKKLIASSWLKKLWLQKHYGRNIDKKSSQKSFRMWQAIANMRGEHSSRIFEAAKKKKSINPYPGEGRFSPRYQRDKEAKWSEGYREGVESG